MSNNLIASDNPPHMTIPICSPFSLLIVLGIHGVVFPHSGANYLELYNL